LVSFGWAAIEATHSAPATKSKIFFIKVSVLINHNFLGKNFPFVNLHKIIETGADAEKRIEQKDKQLDIRKSKKENLISPEELT
jgi:hypothetical protein